MERARRRLLARDGPVCAICGGEIDMDAPPRTPNACEVDHIDPFARGGMTRLDNLQLSHRRCNLIKAGGTTEEARQKLATRPGPKPWAAEPVEPGSIYHADKRGTGYWNLSGVEPLRSSRKW